MTIDLRYIIPIGIFYLPGFLMLIGAFMLGFNLYQVRGVVAVFGALAGFICALVSAVVLFTECRPMLVKIGGAA